jgi:hypothetical protein
LSGKPARPDDSAAQAGPADGKLTKSCLPLVYNCFGIDSLFWSDKEQCF